MQDVDSFAPNAFLSDASVSFLVTLACMGIVGAQSDDLRTLPSHDACKASAEDCDGGYVHPLEYELPRSKATVAVMSTAYTALVLQAWRRSQVLVSRY